MNDERNIERVCVVIDEANLWLGFRGFGFEGCRLDEVSLVDAISKGRRVVDKVIVDSCRSDSCSKTIIFDILRNKGFRLVTRKCNGRQKGVDCDINNIIVKGAWQDLYDTVVIVSGDGDMTPAAEEAHRSGKRVEVASFGRCMSGMLAEECDFFHPLEKVRMVDATRLLSHMICENAQPTFRQTSIYEFNGEAQAFAC